MENNTKYLIASVVTTLSAIAFTSLIFRRNSNKLTQSNHSDDQTKANNKPSSRNNHPVVRRAVGGSRMVSRSVVSEPLTGLQVLSQITYSLSNTIFVYASGLDMFVHKLFSRGDVNAKGESVDVLATLSCSDSGSSFLMSLKSGMVSSAVTNWKPKS